MIKPSLYTGKQLYGNWLFTYKLDGVRCQLTLKGAFSRVGKPLQGLDDVIKDLKEELDAEIFCGSFKETITLVRTLSPLRQIRREEIFTLQPLDERLIIGRVMNPNNEVIQQYLNEAVAKGYEGLVLRNDPIWLKVKKEETFDVKITGFQCGTGKYYKVLGAFLTEKGKVGTGFTDKERYDFFCEDYLGKTIEVGCMELTEDGKFRHARFIRMREDLDAQ